ncbi:MAG: phage virion morphogenesis protein [Paracoccaceae bacterium]
MITIELNDAQISAMLDRVAHGLTDMTPLMQEFGEFLVESTKQRFKDGTDPEGNAWAPKSETTIEQYERRGDTVDFRPLFGPTGRLSSEISYEADADGVRWGSNLIYSAVMQFGAGKGEFGSMANGSPIPWGDIPARPFLGVSADDRMALIDTGEEWLEDITGGN